MNYLTEEQSNNLDDFYQGFTLDDLIEIIEKAEANTQDERNDYASSSV